MIRIGSEQISASKLFSSNCSLSFFFCLFFFPTRSPQYSSRFRPPPHHPLLFFLLSFLLRKWLLLWSFSSSVSLHFVAQKLEFGLHSRRWSILFVHSHNCSATDTKVVLQRYGRPFHLPFACLATQLRETTTTTTTTTTIVNENVGFVKLWSCWVGSQTHKHSM